MKDETLLNISILTEGHFVLSGGKHSKYYFNKRAIFNNPILTQKLSSEIAELYKDSDIEVVIGPATGGIIRSHLVALSLPNKPYGIWVEKEGNGFKFPQTWDGLISGKKTLIVEDVISTGSAIKKTIELCKKQNAEVVGIGVILNRGRLSSENFNGIRLENLLYYPINVWDKDKCELCKSKVPISVDIGHGKEFLDKN